MVDVAVDRFVMQAQMLDAIVPAAAEREFRARDRASCVAALVARVVACGARLSNYR